MGTLYIVATPIGNLKDITLRAIETLKSVDYIVCEDTRVTGKLLNHYGIEKSMSMLNDFNEKSKTDSVIKDLIVGKNIALVSDAGTPLISDPGFHLTREAIASDIKVETIPGPTAISALTISGLPTNQFLFLGFLPKKSGKRSRLYSKLQNLGVDTTVIIYESPFRVVKTLDELKEYFGNIDVVVVREMTKVHEEVLRGEVSKVLESLRPKKPKGEFVILFHL